MVIRDRVEELIEDLKRHENVSDYFYYIRNLDRDRESFSKLSEVERASRFLYLNKS
jgi:DNA adenine methylase